MILKLIIMLSVLSFSISNGSISKANMTYYPCDSIESVPVKK